MSSAIVRRHSFENPFLLARNIWAACSVLYAVVYLLVADLGGHRAYGAFLASTLLLQAVIVVTFVSRVIFATRREAVIRTAALGCALSGLFVTLLFAMTRFRPAGYEYEWARLQVGYITVILFLAGLVNGTLLAMLRWGRLEWPAEQVGSARHDPGWLCWLKSIILWVAVTMACAWMLVPFLGIRASDALGYAGIVVAIPGIFLIAPISAISAADPRATLGKRIWRYARTSLLVLVVLSGGYALLGILLAQSPLILVYIVPSMIYGVPLLWIPCLFWSFLTGLAEAPAAQQAQPVGPQTPGTTQQTKAFANWKLGLLILAAQSCVLLPALLATSPSSLGFRGVGCTSAYSTIPAEYWFWQAYKGVRSLSQSSDGIIFRPATDSSVCIVIAGKSMSIWSDPKQITLGYAEAARSWLWLIDPDEWESTRTKEIRLELTRLLGEEFSSYADLQKWWNQNNEYLVWSGKDEFLEAREPTPQELAHSYAYRLAHPPTVLTAVETFRLHSYLASSQMASGKVEELAGSFHAALFDREARLRGLKLAAADFIDVLSGERERRAREFLESVSGKRFATKAEWENFLGGNPPPPWTMNRASAQEWIGLIGLYGQTEPYRTRYVEKLREATDLTYSTPEEFIPWLENPENTRQDEWRRARDLVGDLNGTNPRYSLDHAMSSLTMITGQSFGSSEDWIKWWQAKRTRLILSADGAKLVVGP